MQRRERPIKRVNPSGKTVFVARPRGAAGERHNRGTFKLKGPCRETGRADCCAQHAIDAFYAEIELHPVTRATVGEFAADWVERYPRSARTDKSNGARVKRVLDIKIEGRPLRDWRFAELKRKQANELVGALFEKGHAHGGVVGTFRTLSCMAEDAITDEVIGANPFKGLRIRKNDTRVRKQGRKTIVLTFEQMHAFAAAAATVETVTRTTKYRWTGYASMNQWRRTYAEPMIRMLADCGLRIGELFALQRDLQDLKAGVFTVRGSAWGKQVVGSSETKHHDRQGPIPPGCLALLRAMPARIDSPLLFPTPTGAMWEHSHFYRDVWRPTRAAAGLGDVVPHDFRHSWVSWLTAAGVDQADLAEIAGHGLGVQTSTYRHAVGRSHDAIRTVIG